jgi:hypothetical protein
MFPDCDYLNTCIGKPNYRPFFALVMAVACMLAAQFALGAYLLIQCFLAPERMEAWMQATYPVRIPLWSAYAVMVGVYCLVAAVALYQVGLLCVVHLALNWKELTTIEFFRLQRESQVQAASQEQASINVAAWLSIPTHVLWRFLSCRRGEHLHELALPITAGGAAQHAEAVARKKRRVSLNPWLVLHTRAGGTPGSMAPSGARGRGDRATGVAEGKGAGGCPEPAAAAGSSGHGEVTITVHSGNSMDDMGIVDTAHSDMACPHELAVVVA